MIITFEQFRQEMRNHYHCGDLKIYQSPNGFGCTYWIKVQTDLPRVDFKLWEIVVTDQSCGMSFDVLIGGTLATRTDSLRLALEFLSRASSHIKSEHTFFGRETPWIPVKDREPEPFEKCWVLWLVRDGDEACCDWGWWDPFQRDWRRTPSEPKTPGDLITWLLDEYADLSKIPVYWAPYARFQDRSQAYGTKHR